MKKMIFALTTMLILALNVQAMSYEQARSEALFLTDKMAYELNLSDAQYEAAYEINLDYLMNVTSYDDVNGIWWERRNQDFSYILYSWQWEAFRAATYFYRPLFWQNGYWHFGIYARYPRRDFFYFGTPHFYVSYRGGHSWHHNGGHSFYEHRRDVFRPGHVERAHHDGLRSRWDRGDYRRISHGNSSTRITAGSNGSHPATGGTRRGGSNYNNSNNPGNRQSGGNWHNSDNGGGRNVGSNANGGHTTGNTHVGGNSSVGGNRGTGNTHVGGNRGTGNHSVGGGHSTGSHSGGSRGMGAPTRSNGNSGRSGSARR